MKVKEKAIEILIKLSKIDTIIQSMVRKRLFWMLNLYSPKLNGIFLSLIPLLINNLELTVEPVYSSNLTNLVSGCVSEPGYKLDIDQINNVIYFVK